MKTNLIRDRIKKGLCPVCGKGLELFQFVKDKTISNKPIKICGQHINQEEK